MCSLKPFSKAMETEMSAVVKSISAYACVKTTLETRQGLVMYVRIGVLVLSVGN